MKALFKPEDFEPPYGKDIAPSIAAELANKKLNELIESWPVVYRSQIPEYDDWGNKKMLGHTQKARLAFIEPIVKKECEHRPKFTASHKGMLFKNTCEKCGVELTATWSEKK
jgi:hypothetical protein